MPGQHVVGMDRHAALPRRGGTADPGHTKLVDAVVT